MTPPKKKKIDKETLAAAVEVVKRGGKIKTTARQFDLTHQTLRRAAQRVADGASPIEVLQNEAHGLQVSVAMPYFVLFIGIFTMSLLLQVITAEQEKALMKYMVKSAAIPIGMPAFAAFVSRKWFLPAQMLCAPNVASMRTQNALRPLIYLSAITAFRSKAMRAATTTKTLTFYDNPAIFSAIFTIFNISFIIQLIFYRQIIISIIFLRFNTNKEHRIL